MENAMHQPRNMPDNELDFLEFILQALLRYIPALRASFADPEVPQETLHLFREIKVIGEMLYVIGCEPRSRNGMEIIEDLYVDFWELYRRLVQHNARLFQEMFNN